MRTILYTTPKSKIYHRTHMIGAWMFYVCSTLHRITERSKSAEIETLEPSQLCPRCFPSTQGVVRPNPKLTTWLKRVLPKHEELRLLHDRDGTWILMWEWEGESYELRAAELLELIRASQEERKVQL